MNERNLCAESFRSSREINVKDWIDEGTLGLYYLRLEYVAQSGGFPDGHPIVDECCAEWGASIYPFHCWLRIVRVMGPGACPSTINVRVDHDAQTVLLFPFRE